VAGVVLGDIDLHFAWQAWHLWHWAGSGGALGPRLTPWLPAAVCVAGVALGDIQCHLAWQAWHLVTSGVIWRLFPTHVAHTFFSLTTLSHHLSGPLVIIGRSGHVGLSAPLILLP